MKTHPRHFTPIALACALLTSSLALQPRPAAAWVTNSPLVTARLSHTATLLPNGKVLVTGGWNDAYLSSAELFDPATGQWTSTGSMSTNRCYHSATLLPNGKVVVVGGYGNASPQALGTAELYDPVTGTWTNTGTLFHGRVFHTATLLTNGRLLVTGGSGRNTAELYDPTSGKWMNTGTMSRARWYHTATLLTNGSVLVAGGDYNYLPPGVSATAEVYDPSSGTWSTTGAMTTNRTSPTATLLPDGKVLVAGGWCMVKVLVDPPRYSSFSLRSAEIFDPASGDWSATTNTMVTGRNDHTASLLPNGQVLVTGGFVNGPGETASMELFDSIRGAWIATTNTLNVARSYHTATLLPGGRIFVAGGRGRNGVIDTTELYDSPTGRWTRTGSLASAGGERCWHTLNLLPDGNVLVVGGFSAGSYLSSAELYHPATGAWTPTGSLDPGRAEHTATLLPNGKLLVAGGYNDLVSPKDLADAALYDPTSGNWRSTGALIAGRYQHTATLLPTGKVLVAGGLQESDQTLRAAEIYNPETEEWTATGDLVNARKDHTATLLPNGKVLVAGGYVINGGSLSSAELFDPATGQWAGTSWMSVVRRWHTATLLPNGKVLVAGGQGELGSLFYSSAELYDPASGSWTPTESMTTPRGLHTARLLVNGKVLVVGGEHDAGALVSLGDAELYDPSTGTWTPTGPLDAARAMHASSCLLDGTVLAVGGYNNGYLSSSEIYDASFERGPLGQPEIGLIASALELGLSLTITGSLFRGISGSSGGTTQDCPTDYPMVQLRGIENEQTTFLFPANWSTDSFTSLPVWDFPPGWALVTVLVNGIPSTSRALKVSVPVPTAPFLTRARTSPGGAFEFDFTNTPAAVFAVLAATNPVLPTSDWMPLGAATEVAPGRFRFADSQAAEHPRRCYRVRSP